MAGECSSWDGLTSGSGRDWEAGAEIGSTTAVYAMNLTFDNGKVQKHVKHHPELSLIRQFPL